MTAREAERLAKLEQKVEDGFNRIDARIDEVIKHLDKQDRNTITAAHTKSSNLRWTISTLLVTASTVATIMWLLMK